MLLSAKAINTSDIFNTTCCLNFVILQQLVSTSAFFFIKVFNRHYPLKLLFPSVTSMPVKELLFISEYGDF